MDRTLVKRGSYTNTAFSGRSTQQQRDTEQLANRINHAKQQDAFKLETGNLGAAPVASCMSSDSSRLRQCLTSLKSAIRSTAFVSTTDGSMTEASLLMKC